MVYARGTRLSSEPSSGEEADGKREEDAFFALCRVYRASAQTPREALIGLGGARATRLLCSRQCSSWPWGWGKSICIPKKGYVRAVVCFPCTCVYLR